MRKSSLIKISVAIAVVIALVIFVTSRWTAWFGNPPEPQYSVSDKVTHLLMTYGDNGEESRTFTWLCGDTIQPAILELIVSTDTVRFEGEGRLFTSRSGVGAYYKTKIASLPRGIKYKYRVLHPSDTTNWYEFDMPIENKEHTFIYIGDVQDNYTGETPKIFSEIFELYPDVHFYLFGGDIIERPMAGYWDYWFTSMQDIPKTKPILAAAGNHEYLKGFPPYLEERFALVFPYAEAEKNKGNALYTVKIGNAQIYILDSNREFWNYGYQSRWLKDRLEESDAKWQIVTMHHPLHSTKGRLNQLLQRNAFKPVIEENEVDLVLQGHEHTYMRTSSISDEGELKTPLYITSHCSPKKYEISYSGNYSKTDNSDKYYQLITYGKDKITIESYTSQHYLLDKVEILSTGRVVECEE